MKFIGNLKSILNNTSEYLKKIKKFLEKISE